MTKLNSNPISMTLNNFNTTNEYQEWKHFSIGVAEKINGINSHGRGSRSKIHRKILALQHHRNRFTDHEKVIDFGVVHSDKVTEGVHNDIKMGKKP